jgi:hypothetical protein
MQLTNVYHIFSILSLHDFTELLAASGRTRHFSFFIDSLRKPAEQVPDATNDFKKYSYYSYLRLFKLI